MYPPPTRLGCGWYIILVFILLVVIAFLILILLNHACYYSESYS